MWFFHFCYLSRCKPKIVKVKWFRLRTCLFQLSLPLIVVFVCPVCLCAKPMRLEKLYSYLTQNDLKKKSLIFRSTRIWISWKNLSVMSDEINFKKLIFRSKEVANTQVARENVKFKEFSEIPKFNFTARLFHKISFKID